jgi:hypothetical protein
VTIAGFYDSVTALTPAENAALVAAPNVEAALKKEFGVVKPERAEERLERKLNTPTLSILAMESGGGLQVAGRSAIPASAAARLEIRLVNGLVPAKQNELVVAHIRSRAISSGRSIRQKKTGAQPMIARVDARRSPRPSR